MTTAIRDNQETSRYELDVGGQIVFAIYRRDGTTLYIRHVEAPPSLRGTGAAGRLMEGITELARAEQLNIVPLCSYAAAWMRRHARP
ncbi:MAG TPA: GNAT family N-acetyltransferase [Alphaproteobacteria bacterium]|nr:GNAT family N-acetyltransferase [Alphaproteobacteria bacterium]